MRQKEGTEQIVSPKVGAVIRRTIRLITKRFRDSVTGMTLNFPIFVEVSG